MLPIEFPAIPVLAVGGVNVAGLGCSPRSAFAARLVLHALEMAEVLENPFLVLLEIVVVEPARPAVVKIQGDEGGREGWPASHARRVADIVSSLILIRFRSHKERIRAIPYYLLLPSEKTKGHTDTNDSKYRHDNKRNKNILNRKS